MTFTKKPALHISIIVLVHNNLETYTKPCITSVLNATLSKNYELILVNNGSTDNTSLWGQELQKKYSHVSYIHSEKNLGFAAGNNLGLQTAKGDIIILLNNDTLVPPGWLPPLIHPFKNHTDLGLVGPVTNKIGSIQQIVLPDYPNSQPDSWINAATNYMQSHENTLMETPKLCFFCVAIHRRCLETVGLLDTNYCYGNFEDDDYCQRVLKQHMKIAYTDASFVWHHGGGTLSQFSINQRKTTWNKNKQYYISQHNKHPLLTEELQNALACIQKELTFHKNNPKTFERCLAHLPYLHDVLNQLKHLEQDSLSIKGIFFRMIKYIDINYLQSFFTSYLYSNRG